MAISSQGADKFRLKHAEELLALFEGARGRPARTTDELAQWLDSVDDDLADDIAREVAEEAGRKAGREAAKKNGREAYEEASYRAYERAYERVLESLKKARRQTDSTQDRYQGTAPNECPPRAHLRGVIFPSTIVIVVGFQGSEAAYAQCRSSNANCLCGWNSACFSEI